MFFVKIPLLTLIITLNYTHALGIKMCPWKVTIFGILDEIFNRQNVLTEEFINRWKRFSGDLLMTLQIYAFRNFWHFLGLFLFSIVHIKAWNTCSNYILFSKLSFTNACRNAGTQCKIFYLVNSKHKFLTNLFLFF